MLLEREDHLAQLDEAIELALQDSGQLVLVAGEAGSGKTTLVNALEERIDGSILVVKGGCDPLSTPRPLSPLHDFASNPDAGLEGLFDGDRDNVGIFNEVLDRLRHSMRPMVLVIEDIHWADEATLDLIRFVGRRINTTNATVIATYRDDEVGADHPLRPVLGQLIPLDSTQRLEVPGLSEEAVASLASGSAVDPKQLHHVTGGNAFFVSEVLAAGESLPATVQDVVVARVARLADGPRRAVEAVSIAPRSLDVEYAALLASGRLTDIDNAVGSGVLLGDGRQLRFRHELARAAIESSIPIGRRHDLHRKMIALLVEEDPTDHARLAHHAIRAEQPELIVEHAPRAAAEARERFSVREEVAFRLAALEHAELMDARTVADMQVQVSEGLYILDRIEDADQHLAGAIQWYEANGMATEQAMALRRLSLNQQSSGKVDDAFVSAVKAVEILEREPEARAGDLAIANATVAHQHMLRRDAGLGMPIAERAQAYADEASLADVSRSVRHTIACLQMVGGQVDDGLAALRVIADEARADNDRLYGSAITNLGSGAGEMRRYAQAESALNEAVQWCVQRDLDGAARYARSWQARVAFEQGRWDDAVRLAEPVVNTELNPASYSVVTAKGAIGRVRIRRGDPGGEDLLQQAIEDGAGHHLQHLWPLIAGLAESNWVRGDEVQAVSVIEDLYRRALETDSEWAKGELGYWMWKARAIDGPPEGAAEPFAAQMVGNWETAADLWREIGCPFEVALSLTESGQTEPMLEALEIFDMLGAKPMSDKTRAALRGLGVESIPRGPVRSTRENQAGLTNRQMEVLDLMREGLSNSDIADRLFISKKTVEHHVSAIFSKLGVESREKAVEALEVSS